jgi:catechol 2,3-dioxygenase-like lactoylglutathione lyase family enzyme
MEPRISLVTVGVADLARSRRFYAEGLGWRPVLDTPEIVFFQLGPMVLGLWPFAELAKDARLPLPSSPVPAGGIALAHNVRSRAEVDALLKAAVRAGASLLKPGQEQPWGGYSGYFADPDGHPWEVAWNPAWMLDDEGRVTFGV